MWGRGTSDFGRSGERGVRITYGLRRRCRKSNRQHFGLKSHKVSRGYGKIIRIAIWWKTWCRLGRGSPVTWGGRLVVRRLNIESCVPTSLRNSRSGRSRECLLWVQGRKPVTQPTSLARYSTLFDNSNCNYAKWSFGIGKRKGPIQAELLLRLLLSDISGWMNDWGQFQEGFPLENISMESTETLKDRSMASNL